MSRLAGVCLVLMMAVTIADVLRRSLFGKPIFGSFEMVEIMMVASIFLALPETFYRDQHVTVDVVDQVVPVPVKRALQTLAALLSLALTAILAWNMVSPALDAMRYGETTLDLKMPLTVFWVPMLVGMALSALAMAVVLVRLVTGKRASSAPEATRVE
jgi:TRAP-type C4-dicarboxylate transport system permease small subunit